MYGVGVGGGGGGGGEGWKIINLRFRTPWVAIWTGKQGPLYFLRGAVCVSVKGD